MRTKKPKHSNNQINMYYEQEFQLEQDRLNNVDKKKIKEREKRIKQMNKEKSRVDEKFDFDTETVIGMTNKNHQAKRKEIQNRSFHGNYGDDHVCNTVAVSEHHAEPVQKHRNLERRTAVRRGAAEKKQKPRKRLADRR